MKPRILLIDLSAIFHPAWRCNENAPVTVAFESTLGGVHRCMGKVGDGALVAVCLDSRKNWRKELLPAYKSQRDPLPSVFYAQLDKVKERLTKDGMLLWGAEGFEADDIIATATLQAFNAGHEVLIATHDKDMFQLVGEGVKVLSLSTFEERDSAAVLTKFGVPPASMGDWLALVGDASDNVKGAPGIGPKRAAELLSQYGSLFEVLKAAYDLKNGMTPAIRKSLTENGEQIELARKLVTLRTDAPIRFEEIYETREQKPITEVDDMPHDLGTIQEEIEDKAQEVHRTITGLQAGPPPVDGADSFAVAEQGLVKSYSPDIIPAEYSRALEPRSFRDTMIVAKYLFNSRLYQKFTSPEAIAAIIMRGRELGYGAGTALEVFHVIEGRPYPFAYLVVAECQKDPDCEYLLPVEFDAKHAIAETKHRKMEVPIRLSYTIDQAKEAGLIRERNGWAKNPEDMLVKTALSKLGRRTYPGRALGLVSLEEIGEA